MTTQSALAQPHTMHPNVANALADCRRAFWSVAVFSGVVNVLMLAGPLYMLQIYDRVLSSRSVSTLLALSVFLVGAYLFQGALDLIRSRVVVRAAALLDQNLGTTVHATVIRLSVLSRNAAQAHQPVRDLDQIRTFLTSAGPIAVVDLPWVPVFLAICFLIHPWLGFVALAGAIILLTITVQTERGSRAPARNLATDFGIRAGMIEVDRRNSETVVAMGMADVLAKRWSKVNDRYLTAVGRSSDVVSGYGSFSKVIRLLLQSAMLGLGAYLVIRQELTAGSMIAASIMMGRALAPIETAIANWRSFISARQSIHRLSEVLARTRTDRIVTELPKPTSSITVEQLAVAAPNTPTIILNGVQFRLAAGEALGIIGPSGAGKTSLLRTLVGIWQPLRGIVRFDGAALNQWDPIFFGRYIGYVSQSIELFEGTIAENITRMAIEPDNNAVLEAANVAGAHDLILRLPLGYDTRIGEGSTVLSAGQQQRIALARALYGNPFLLALDEPSSNLDNEGEVALQKAIQNAKAKGLIVIMIAHRSSALANCDKVLLLANGTQQAYGPRDEVLQKFVARPLQTAVSGNLKVVRDSTGGVTDDR